MRTERNALLLSAVMALVVGGAGLTLAILTNSRAILLDGMFNLTYFVVALAAVRVAQLTRRPDDEHFPWGYSYFESLINAGKGLLILGISAVALVDSVLALISGGREVVAGLAIAYAVFATLACSLTALLIYWVWRLEPTSLVRADLENWVVNSLVSAAVLTAFCSIPIARAMGYPALTPFVDPALVAAVVLICLGVPIRMAWSAIMELLDRAPPAHVTAPVKAAVDAVLAPLPVRRTYLRVVRPGRTLFVSVHVLLPPDFQVGELARLDRIREQVHDTVRRLEPTVITDVLFTTDPRWAAPASVGG